MMKVNTVDDLIKELELLKSSGHITGTTPVVVTADDGRGCDPAMFMADDMFQATETTWFKSREKHNNTCKVFRVF